MSRAIVLDEHLGDDGTSLVTLLRQDDEGALWLVEGGRESVLPRGAVEAVFARFGGELADDVVVTDDGLGLDAGVVLKRLRHLARYDVLARDYLVLMQAACPARVALGVTVAGALRHLARAAETA